MSNSATSILSNTKLKIKVNKEPKVDISNVILVSLMQYNGAFNNLVTSTTPIEQNHPDLYNYIYNNLNGYKTGINHLINIYSTEMEKYLKLFIIIVTLAVLAIFIGFILFFFLVNVNFLAAIEKRGKYMKVFYGINENILKTSLSGYEFLMNKLKSSEEQRYHEEETINESIEEKITLENNQKINQKKKTMQQNSNLNYGIENKKSNNISSFSVIFIILYGLSLLIYLGYSIYNGIYMINISKESISITNTLNKLQSFHLGIIDVFNVYREYLFDNQSIINGSLPFEYLTNSEDESLIQIIEDIQYLSSVFQNLITNNENITLKDDLCSYYLNDYFDSSVDCSDRIGLITGYDFFTLSYYFLEEIKIVKNIVSYKLEYEEILGNLTDYKINEYINDPNIENLNPEEDYTKLFRLDLFNDKTIHKDLNVIFFSIILPYIQETRKIVFQTLTLENVDNFLILINSIFAILITIIFFIYFFPMIKFISFCYWGRSR